MKNAIRNFVLTALCLFSPLPLWGQQEVPEAAKGHFKAGIALIEKAEKPGDFQGAITEFEAAATLAPEWPEIHYNLAKLAAETDRPAKAMKEYRTYLKLVPAAGDRAVVEGEMARMKEMIARKRKIGLPGVKFAALADGIVTLEVFPGARVAGTGLQRGDKIVAVNNVPVAGHSLENFFKAIEAANQEAEKSQSKATSGRLSSRFGMPKGESGAVMILHVVRGTERSTVLIQKTMFQSNLIEIEEEEFEVEVVKETQPVVVTFWNSGCQPCREFTPVIEAESAKYTGKAKFVNINVDENKRLAHVLAVKGIPTMMVFKAGNAVSRNTGRLDKDRVAEILNTTVATR